MFRRRPLIVSELKWQLARQPSRAWLAGMGLIGFGSVWALLVAVALLLGR